MIVLMKMLLLVWLLLMITIGRRSSTIRIGSDQPRELVVKIHAREMMMLHIMKSGRHVVRRSEQIVV